MRGSAAALPVLLAVLLLPLGTACRAQHPSAQGALPSSLGDAEFWRMANVFSEPDGPFESENLLSNERTLQHAIPELEAQSLTGGVYIGVGPEQNFTLLAALRPRLAFVVDIRRQNFVLHLFYKALFELAADRADFLSMLFGRARPAGLPNDAPVDDLFLAYRNAAQSEGLHRHSLETVKDHLTRRRGFALSKADLRSLEHVATAFYRGGPDITYDDAVDGSAPTYAELMSETDGRGAQRSFLASEAGFRVVAELQRNNAIVPVVGDFAGPHALRSIGRYVAEHGALVTEFYVSNVEVYLSRSDAWRAFYANLATLPMDARSTLIRAVSRRALALRREHDAPGMQLRSLGALADAFASGGIEGYFDALEMPR